MSRSSQGYMVNLSNFISNPPYRSKNKIKHILKNKFDEYIPDKDLLFIGPPPLNNIDIKQTKKKYSHKVIAPKNSYIGDIIFPVEYETNIMFLLLIEINTRKAYAKKLENRSREAIMDAFRAIDFDIVDEGFNRRIDLLRFDGEKGVNSKEFKRILKKSKIEFVPIEPNQHTALSLIDRLCNTIRNIAFNLNITIRSNEDMNLILDYYNNAPHKTLTKYILQGKPELRSIFKYGITPNEVASILELELIFMKECMKHNIVVVNEYENIVGKLCRLYVRYEDKEKFKKKRSKLTTDIYRVVKKEGYLFRCINTKNKDDIKLRPRFEIVLV